MPRRVVLNSIRILAVLVVISGVVSATPVMGIDNDHTSSVSADSPGQGLGAAMQVSTYQQQQFVQQRSYEHSLDRSGSKQQVVEDRINDLQQGEASDDSDGDSEGSAAERRQAVRRAKADITAEATRESLSEATAAASAETVEEAARGTVMADRVTATGDSLTMVGTDGTSIQQIHDDGSTEKIADTDEQVSAIEGTENGGLVVMSTAKSAEEDQQSTGEQSTGQQSSDQSGIDGDSMVKVDLTFGEESETGTIVFDGRAAHNVEINVTSRDGEVYQNEFHVDGENGSSNRTGQSAGYGDGDGVRLVESGGEVFVETMQMDGTKRLEGVVDTKSNEITDLDSDEYSGDDTDELVEQASSNEMEDEDGDGEAECVDENGDGDCPGSDDGESDSDDGSVDGPACDENGDGDCGGYDDDDDGGDYDDDDDGGDYDDSDDGGDYDDSDDGGDYDDSDDGGDYDDSDDGGDDDDDDGGDYDDGGGYDDDGGHGGDDD